ncbi:hypothetical protein PR202_ga04573 [Eleusine coracana subsp. coracana]|uniref:Kinesin motor domain-containing protein n=1 Tax=Eleusine coracana subsp. coracana TaxID=191504 RepID=A0AAV5BRB9_ELECO|nr:hypothetical protein PR202_ga04573 [Eleusine coracana subsp. coracana]
MEPDPAAAETPSPPPSPSPPASPPLEPRGEIPAIASSPPPPNPAQIAAMEPDPVTAETPSPPPPPASSPLEPRGDEHERGAVEPAADPANWPQPSPTPVAPPPPQPQQTYDEDAAGSSEVVQEKEVVAEVGEALRHFMEEFGDQGEEYIIQSQQLKSIATPDRPAVLGFLGEKYNNLLRKYKKQTSKCADECVPRYDGLMKKYTDECAERRRLNNELIELKGNIRVFCRCRPLSADEVTHGCSSIVEIEPLCETELQFLPFEKERKAFRFDHVFGPEDSQEAVFAETVPVVRSVMDGFNVCIFAYGQTGTGKTFTMEGVPENRGVNYRALEELFRMSEERSASVAYTFSVSILELYNEQINDLLDETSKNIISCLISRLEIKQTSDGTQDVPGLIDAPIYTIDGVWEKLKVGAKNRSVGSTNANELSSRSHSFVRVTVRSEHLVTGQQSKSYMWLVDLAGSERYDKTGADGERLKESQYINKSLSALGDVMSALASKKSSHIPYRNSKLTHLLQSSLGGDCKTLMFVQISPSSSDAGETLNSLKYASRVRSIEHVPSRKQAADPVDSLKLKQMTEKLRHVEKENDELKRTLQLMELKYASRENTFRLLNDKVRDAERKCRDYQQLNKELENELVNEKKAAREPGRSSRPPLVPMRQRQPPQGRNNSKLPPFGPSRSRFSKAPTIQNKENIPVMGTKAHLGADKERRVSLTP